MVRINWLATNVNHNRSSCCAATCVLKMEELSNAVGSNYLIVKNIIKHMAWREVEVAERVCGLWQEVVRELRKTELYVQHFRFNYLNEGHPVSFVASPECFGAPELLITMQNQFSYNEPGPCPLNPCLKTIDRWSRVCPYCTEVERKLICFNLSYGYFRVILMWNLYVHSCKLSHSFNYAWSSLNLRLYNAWITRKIQ